MHASDNGVSTAFNTGNDPGSGTHRIRLTWDAAAQQARLQVDTDYTGGAFTADQDSGLIDGSDNGFNDTNTHIYFGGNENLIFDDLSITKSSQSAVTIGTAAFLDDVTIIGGDIDVTGAFSNQASEDITLQSAGGGTITIDGDVAVAGSGAVSLSTARDIVLNAGASITTVDGDLTLSANRQASPTAGDFNGISILTSTLTTNGIGDILITGRSGNTGSGRGIHNQGQAIFNSTASGSTAGTITLLGDSTGSSTGQGILSQSHNNRINSVDGDVTVTGNSVLDTGIYSGRLYVSSTGVGANAANITITGTGANRGMTNDLIDVTTVDGDLLMTGNGGSNWGVAGPTYIDSIGTGPNAGTITIVGNSASGSGIRLNRFITTVDGDVSLTSSGLIRVDRSNGSADFTSTGTGADAGNFTFTAAQFSMDHESNFIQTDAGDITITTTGGNLTSVGEITAAGGDVQLTSSQAISLNGGGVSTSSGNLIFDATTDLTTASNVVFSENFDSLDKTNPQLEDGAGGEGSGNNGWTGSDTDSGDLNTTVQGTGDQNVLIHANTTGDGLESSLNFIRSNATFGPFTETDSFSLAFNVEDTIFSESYGQFTIGFANGSDNLFGIGAAGFADQQYRVGISDWTVFPGGGPGIKHPFAAQSTNFVDRSPSFQMDYDGLGNARLRAFSGQNATGSVHYDSGFVPLNGVAGSTLSTFSVDRIFIANDQTAAGTLRIRAEIDDIEVRAGYSLATTTGSIDVTAGGTMTLAGDIDHGSGGTSVTVVGATSSIDGNVSGTGPLSVSGNLMLTGSNTFSGGTTIPTGSTGRVFADSALGTGAVTVAAGGFLGLNNDITVANPLTLEGASGTGALANTSGDNTYTGDITLTGSSGILVNPSSTLTIDGNVALGGNELTTTANDTLTINGVVSGTGSLTKEADGTVELTAANTYDGLTTVNSGTVSLTGAGTLGSLAAGTVVNPGYVSDSSPWCRSVERRAAGSEQVHVSQW